MSLNFGLVKYKVYNNTDFLNIKYISYKNRIKEDDFVRDMQSKSLRLCCLIIMAANLMQISYFVDAFHPMWTWWYYMLGLYRCIMSGHVHIIADGKPGRLRQSTLRTTATVNWTLEDSNPLLLIIAVNPTTYMDNARWRELAHNVKSGETYPS